MYVALYGGVVRIYTPGVTAALFAGLQSLAEEILGLIWENLCKTHADAVQFFFEYGVAESLRLDARLLVGVDHHVVHIQAVFGHTAGEQSSLCVVYITSCSGDGEILRHETAGNGLPIVSLVEHGVEGGEYDIRTRNSHHGDDDGESQDTVFLVRFHLSAYGGSMPLVIVESPY